MKSIIFITDNIFTKRDYLRFNIQKLKKNYKVKVINLSKYIKPDLNNNLNFNFKDLLYFSDLHNIKKFFLTNNNSIVFDFLGSTREAWEVRKFLKRNNIQIAKIYNGYFPLKKKNLIQRILDNFNKKKQGSILFKLKNNFYNFLNRNFLPDFALVGGDFYKKNLNRNIKNIINIHSWDYDIFKNKNLKKKKENYAVFLDTNLMHPLHSS